MALINFTAPFLATPHPPLPHAQFYHHQQHPQAPLLQPPTPYAYPPPRKPFEHEDYTSHHLPPPPPPHPQPHHAHLHHQPHFTKITDEGTKTKVHAVIDYDEDEDDNGNDGQDYGSGVPPVTPIQGPIYIKNGSVPVVPLYSHPVLNNGTFVQIPILWTALSVALGLELRGEYIRGVPCIKRHQQLFCPTAGNSYPLDRIELFIDENKALMKRMYGEFDMEPPDEDGESENDDDGGGGGGGGGASSGGGGTRRRRRQTGPPGVPDLHFKPTPAAHVRDIRQTFRGTAPPPPATTANQNGTTTAGAGGGTGRLDACESKVEIVTPYWASNSAGKIRAIVNTQHFEQAIHQEVCAKAHTNRCSGDCGCEQKYKWHRLLAYDPDNDCKGIFMDWFLFPSCCVCRCNPT